MQQNILRLHSDVFVSFITSYLDIDFTSSVICWYWNGLLTSYNPKNDASKLLQIFNETLMEFFYAEFLCNNYQLSKESSR